jgi:LPXTG-motif cell wall-anchored protein
VAAATILITSGLFVAPANATTIDVSGVTFNFSNPSSADIGVGAAIGAEFNYANVATVDGVVIDATVTVVNASSSSMANDPAYEYLDATFLDAMRVNFPEAVDVAGCYSNAEYRAADPAVAPYEQRNFVPADLLPGQVVEVVDEYDSDAALDGAINLGTDLCGYGVSGIVALRVSFTVDDAPVTLNNLTLFAGDIDGLQSMTLLPVPTTYSVSPNSVLVVTESAESVMFKSPDEGSSEDDPTALNFVAEASYDGVSSFTYEFGLEDSSGGSLSMRFESFFNPATTAAPELAATGVDATPAITVGMLALLLGGVFVSLKRVRRNQA